MNGPALGSRVVGAFLCGSFVGSRKDWLTGGGSTVAASGQGYQLAAAASVEKLISAANKPGNTIQVLPIGAGEHASMGSAFSILTLSDPMDSGIVYVETRAGSLYLEGHDVREHSGVFAHLVAAALSSRASISMLESAARS